MLASPSPLPGRPRRAEQGIDGQAATGEGCATATATATATAIAIAIAIAIAAADQAGAAPAMSHRRS